ncbi:Probable C-terminal domain small phosphatase (Developmental gene 1148 protein) [Durusdinium trenchii]|uniref:Mitochondrial import inner membrane translocase subunit TIM50 n=1 Tax=Durusdinium trenchii TaxID=1381693 RepID=A0ABP0ISD6_9DINO
MPRLSLKDVDLQRLPQQARAALEFLVLLNPREIIPDATAARQPTLLPPQKPEHAGRRTLVLDLDETLVHCHCQQGALPGPHPEIQIELENGEPKAVLRAKVFVRPFARRLLLLAAARFEVVVFTASAAIYADKVLDGLDPGRKLIAHRLYREACSELAGGHFKDLRRLGRPLDDLLLVDNSPLALGLLPENGMLITSWYGDDEKDMTVAAVEAVGDEWGRVLGSRSQLRAFVAELTRQSFAVCAVPLWRAAPVVAELDRATPRGSSGHSGGFVWSFKRQGELKDGWSFGKAQGERTQVRRTSLEAADPNDFMLCSFEVMESLAEVAMEAWCASQGLPVATAKQKFGDLSFGNSQEEGKGKSVLNLYHYFNLETCDEEPCRSHADPGLLTVLCRSTEPGLQALHPLKPGGAPGQPAAYEDSWCDLEPMMDALGQGDLGNPENMGML